MAKCGKCDPHEICEECPEWIFTLADLIMCMMGLFVILWVLKPDPGKTAHELPTNDDQLVKVLAIEQRENVGCGVGAELSSPEGRVNGSGKAAAPRGWRGSCRRTRARTQGTRRGVADKGSRSLARRTSGVCWRDRPGSAGAQEGLPDR